MPSSTRNTKASLLKEEVILKNGLKTLAMWLIIGVIFIVLLTSILDNQDTKMTYSELITKMETAEISEIELSADAKKAYVTVKGDNNKKEVNIPSIDSFMTYAVKVVEYDELKFTQMRTPQILQKVYLNL